MFSDYSFIMKLFRRSCLNKSKSTFFNKEINKKREDARHELLQLRQQHDVQASAAVYGCYVRWRGSRRACT